MSYGQYEDNKCRYKLSNRLVIIKEKEHQERTHVVMFKNTDYADDYFVNNIGGSIAKIVKYWSYYIWYYKVQIGDIFRFYCVHQDDEYKYSVYETKLINKKWIDVCQIEKGSPIYDLIMDDFNKKEDDRRDRINREWNERVERYRIEHPEEYEEDKEEEKDYYDLFGQEEEEECWAPGLWGDSNLWRY